MKFQTAATPSCASIAIRFSVLYCASALILFIGLTILGYIVVKIQELDGPVLVVFYVSFVIAVFCSIPIAMLQLAVSQHRDSRNAND